MERWRSAQSNIVCSPTRDVEGTKMLWKCLAENYGRVNTLRVRRRIDADYLHKHKLTLAPRVRVSQLVRVVDPGPYSPTSIQVRDSTYYSLTSRLSSSSLFRILRSENSLRVPLPPKSYSSVVTTILAPRESEVRSLEVGAPESGSRTTLGSVYTYVRFYHKRLKLLTDVGRLHPSRSSSRQSHSSQS